MQASNIPNYILRVLPLLSTPPHKALCLCSTQPCVYMQWELLCRYLSVKKMQGLPSTGLDMPLRIRHVICSWTPPPFKWHQRMCCWWVQCLRGKGGAILHFPSHTYHSPNLSASSLQGFGIRGLKVRLYFPQICKASNVLPDVPRPLVNYSEFQSAWEKRESPVFSSQKHWILELAWSFITA